jgi:predicted nucleotidyltransferase
MEKDLAEGIKRVAEALNKHDVEYMFVGGVAISFYGNPRPSSNLPKGVEYDIDVWYQASNDNFIKLIRGITEISPELKNELNEIVFNPKKTFIKFSLDEFHFDFLPELVAFYHKDFKKCFTSKVVGEIDGVKFNVISKNDLLQDKERLARDKDLADLENLKKNSYKGFTR